MKKRRILVSSLLLYLIVTLLPATALAYDDIVIIPGESTPNTVSGYNYTFTVGDTVNLRFYGTGPMSMPKSPPHHTGILPSGLSLTNYDMINRFFSVAGTCANATSGALGATLSFTSIDTATATRAITITVHKVSPTISGTNALSGMAGFMGPKTASATITNGYFGGTTPTMPLTATVTDGTNTATASATATGANVSFDFPAAQLNTLAAGGPYDITVGSFAGNDNNNSFAAAKIGELTVAAPTYGITLTPSGDKTFASATVGYGAQTPHSVTVSNNGTGDAGALTVTLGGTNPGDFQLSKTALTVAAGTPDGFTVAPKTGLNAGTHTATVTISGGHGISESFTVRFAVRPLPSPLPRMGDGFPLGALLALLGLALAASGWLGLRMRHKKTQA